MPDKVVAEVDDKIDESISEADDSKRKSNPAVTRERIERLKKAFRPNWLLDSINAPDKGPSSKKDK